MAPTGGEHTVTWPELIRGLTVVIGLLCGVVTLKDHRDKRERSFRSDLYHPLRVPQFLGFLQANDGRTVRLQVDFENSWFTELSFYGTYQHLFLWGYRRRPPDPGEPPPFVVWLDSGREGDVHIATGKAGIGSYTWRGRFYVRDRGPGGAVFPSSVHSYELIPAPLP